MNAKTATKQTSPTETQAASEKREVAVFQPPRLPYHAAIKERFNIEPSGWKALVEAIYPAAKSVDAVVMALSYCKARNLDPFKRPVHIVPMYDVKKKAYVETIWPGISELRTTAARTGNYAGCDEAEFGPRQEKAFTGKVKVGSEWETKTIKVSFPEWCRVTVYRMMPSRERVKFVGPKVLWLESYATIGRSELPNDMWQSRPEGQLEKCAEAAALRRAFPEEIGNELTADEMSGRVIEHDPNESVGRAPAITGPTPEQVKSGKTVESSLPDDVVDVVGEEIIEGEPVTEAEDPTPKGGDLPNDEKAWLSNLEESFSSCEDAKSFWEVQDRVMAPYHGKMSKEAWAKARELAEQHHERVKSKK